MRWIRYDRDCVTEYAAVVIYTDTLHCFVLMMDRQRLIGFVRLHVTNAWGGRFNFSLFD